MCSLATSPSIANLFNYGTCLITKSVIPLLFTLAVVFFVWGVVKYFIVNADEEAKRTEGKQFMIWGIVAIAVLISVWGLVRMLGSTFVPRSQTQILPGVQPRGGVNIPNTSGGGGGSTGTGGGLPPPGNECVVNSDCENMGENAYCAFGYCHTPI